MPEGFVQEDPLWSHMEEQQTFPPSQLPASVGTSKVARRSTNFTVGQDENLVNAWLDTSNDPIVGNQQKSGAFWERVHAQFMQSNDPLHPRTKKALDHRWHYIQEMVMKFCGCYDKILAMRASGKTEQDKIADAVALFTGMYKRGFNLLHCWRILKGHPKWVSCLEDLRSKAQGPAGPSSSVPANETPMTNSSANLEEDTPTPGSDYIRRPGGKKAAKKRSRDDSSGSYDVLMDELRIGRRERSEKMSQIEERSLSVEMEMVAIKKERMRMQESELQLRREELEFNHNFRRDKLQLQKQKEERESQKVLLEAAREDERIMTIDLEALPERARAYYMRRQEEILARMGFK